jgi:hypothetical protein
MKITRDNYELFLVDYWDNKLSPTEMTAVDAFLSENPDIESEMNGANEMILAPLDITFDSKKNLQSNLMETAELEESQQLPVAELEGDLDETQRLRLAELKKVDASLVQQAKIYAHTILRPDFSIKYKQKGKIKKQTISLYWAYGAAAALAAVALMISGVFAPNTTPQLATASPKAIEAESGRQIEVKPGTIAQAGIPSNNTKADTSSQIQKKKPTFKKQAIFLNEEYQLAKFEDDAPQTASMMDYRECVQLPRAEITAPAEITHKPENPSLSKDLLKANATFRKANNIPPSK